MPKVVTLDQLTETLDRVRGMLVHYRVLGPDKTVVDQTLRELDDVEAVLAEAFEPTDSDD
jgi:hypothetical protein